MRDPTNYRPIALLSRIRKIIDKALDVSLSVGQPEGCMITRIRECNVWTPVPPVSIGDIFFVGTNAKLICTPGRGASKIHCMIG